MSPGELAGEFTRRYEAEPTGDVVGAFVAWNRERGPRRVPRMLTGRVLRVAVAELFARGVLTFTGDVLEEGPC